MGVIDTAAKADLKSLENDLLMAIEQAEDLTALEDVRISSLGKKGKISQLMKGLGAMAPEDRKTFGQAVNSLKQRVSDALAKRKDHLSSAALAERLATEQADITLPVRTGPLAEGRIHPLSQVIEEVTEIFADMGFGVAEGPDIETDYYNFTALNTPPEHPARQMQDTLYFGEKEDGSRRLLRSQTSAVQIRHMEHAKPPIRIVAPGRAYRSDYDATHTPQFHQIEGLVIDRESHMGHLRWCLVEFCKAFFEVDNVKMRFRPSYFPFTEPSAEVDIQCDRSGDQVKFGEGDDWMEILGCGMVHPNVLRNVGLDPEKFQGFAFGVGLDRLAMLKYGMPDLRPFFWADLRWLKHYGFLPFDVPTLAGGLSS